MLRPRRSGAGRGRRSRRRCAGPWRARRRTARRARACRSGRGRPARALRAAPSPSSAISIVELAGAVADRHARAAPGRVLERVGQRLLHDPVGGQVDPARQRAHLALDAQLDRQPRLAHLGRRGRRRAARLGCGASASSSSERRSMPSSRRISAIAPRPVCSIVSSTSAVCGRSPPSARRSAPACTTMMREAVGDDVVELARDPRALLGDREPRLLLALVLELDRARGERLGQLVAAAHDRRRAPDREQDAADEQRVADRVLADRDRHRDDRDRDHGCGDAAVAAVGVGAAGVGRDAAARRTARSGRPSRASPCR